MDHRKQAAASRERMKGYASGGAVSGMADPRMAPTDEAITDQDIKTWGTPQNARAAADARKNARERPVSKDEAGRIQMQMGRKSGGRV